MSEIVSREVAFNADGTFADARVLRRAKVLNTAAGCLGALWYSLVMGQYLPLFARKFNADDLAIGFLATIPSLAHVFQIVSAYVVERLGRRKPFWAVSETSRRMVMGLLIFLPVFFTPDRYDVAVMTLLVILGISSVLGSAGFSPWYSWMADIIPERERGRFWGVRNAFVNAAIIIFLPVFGKILDSYGGTTFDGFTIMFVAALVIGVTDITIHSFIPEPPMKRSHDGVHLVSMIMKPLRDRDFRNFFLGWGLWSFATLITTPFYSVYYKEQLQIDYAFLGLLTSISVSAAVVGSWFWGIVADKFGSRPVFNICTIASIPTLGLFFLMDPSNARPLLSLQAFYGGFIAAGMGVGFTNLLLGLSPREGRGMFVAVFFSTTGALSAVAPIVGGLIARNTTEFFLGGFTKYHNLITLSFVLYLFCLPFFLRIREQKAAPIGLMLANLMFTNPVRTFARIGVLNAGRSAKSSASAVRSLGATRSRLATEDLMARLDDPSVIVREEAISALGEIGDPSAVQALTDRLKDREAYSSLAIIRSLGMIGDPSSLETLLGFLDDNDRHVRAAAARSLGRLGDPRAIAPLKDLIQREDRPQVVANAVESLGDIGQASDMWEILPYLRNISNPILKRQVALAVGSLLGKRDEFYSVISKERRRPGRAVSKMCSRLMKTIARGRPAPELAAALDAFRRAYDGADIRRCVALLWDAGYVIARDVYAFDGPREMLLEVAVLRDARFAAGLWFLQMLESGEIEPTMDDVLLGLYFLASAEYRDVVRLS